VKISEVKKNLLAKEHTNAAQAGADASLMEITATSLIIAALDIEELQYVHHLIHRVYLSTSPQTKLDCIEEIKDDNNTGVGFTNKANGHPETGSEIPKPSTGLYARLDYPPQQHSVEGGEYRSPVS
jgi:hypothetical protein